MREVTLSRKIRQKEDIFCPRGPYLFCFASVRSLPRLNKKISRGLFIVGSHQIPCAIGRAGIGAKMREGDGRTPIGRHVILDWMRRSDRWTVFRPDSHPIRMFDGWCDDPESPQYNRPVRLPFQARTESLWRSDGVYDVIGLIDFNLRPRVIGRGSAIFIHLAQADFRSTEGCVALSRDNMRKLQSLWRRRLEIRIGD